MLNFLHCDVEWVWDGIKGIELFDLIQIFLHIHIYKIPMADHKNENIDTVTHPSCYRDAMNGKVNIKLTGLNIEETKKCQESNENNWDLYPQMIRKVENEGSVKQVEHLHELEHSPSR